MTDDNDYEVGYGRPPKKSRWKPGESGNPSGKKKGPRSVKGILVERLAEKVLVKQGGRALKVSTLDALLRKLIALAGNGNAAAMKMLLSLMDRYGLGIDVPEPDPEMDYQARKSLYIVLGRWLERVEKQGITADFSAEEVSEILYTADGDVLQMELPFPPPGASNGAHPQMPRAPIIYPPTTESDDDILY